MVVMGKMHGQTRLSYWLSLLGFLFVSLVVCLRFVVAPALGWCFYQERYIPDEEFIGAVKNAIQVRMEMVGTSVIDNGEVERVKLKDSIYRDWDFDPDNPNCCRVTRDNRSRLLAVMIGQGDVVVEVNPRKNKSFIVGSDSNYRFFFDGCGLLRSSDMGLPDTYQRVIQTKETGR